MKTTLNNPTSAAMGLFEGIQERVRNSRGKQATSVRATEVLLYTYSVLGEKDVIFRMIIEAYLSSYRGLLLMGKME